MNRDNELADADIGTAAEVNDLAQKRSEIQEGLTRARNLRMFFEELDDDIPEVDDLRINADFMLERLEAMLETLGGTLEEESDELSNISDLDPEWEEIPESLDADRETDLSDDEEFASDNENERKKLPRMAESRSLLAPDQDAKLAIRFAPGEKPITGTFYGCFIDIRWKDKKGVGTSSVGNMARGVSRIYKDLSDNQYILKITVKSVSVPFNHNRQNLYKAASYAKGVVNRAKNGNAYDFYGIVHGKVRPYSNAGGDTAYLTGALIRTGCHEHGHNKPLKLGHAGKYVAIKGGGTRLDAYGDPQSFMGRFASMALNAPQLYHLGWIAKNRVAQHELTDEPREYTIEKIGVKNPSELLKAVRIPTEGRNMFLSIDAFKGKNVFKLHYRQNGGSQLIKTFAKEAEYKGLMFERQEIDGNTARVRISPAPSV